MPHPADPFTKDQIDGLKGLLERYGLKVSKTENKQLNLGISPELALLVAINSPSGWMIVNAHKGD